MPELVLAADTGRLTGTRPSRRLRSEGKVPGVVYGMGQDAQSVAVDWPALRKALTTEAGLNALIDLDVDGAHQLSIVKELQRHPVRREVVHVDFLRIDPDVEIQVDVPITLVGEAREVIAENGMVDQTMFSLSVHSRPDAIPSELVADISALTVGDSLRVSDLSLPTGVRTEVEADEAIAIGMVTRSTLESMAEDEAAEALAEAESELGEGGEAAGEADQAEGDATGDDD
ncbi:MAG: 50S ribosomal protein L25 [Acidimicrobiia bacterium]|nr:50S ribosomal protein L25 [Acidimicrobiia bacterium]